LLKAKYIKEEPNHPERGCNYYSIGDFTNENNAGEVCCPIHGTILHPNPDYYKHIDKTPKSKTQIITEGLKKICFSMLRFVLIVSGIANLIHIFNF
ncbi:MAG: hypothetical protein IKP71_06260, partial [Candidatus Riflebacteria bacterium]|nr:hypothetical protein [Candidatus Riflebacteria bacterium]